MGDPRQRAAAISLACALVGCAGWLGEQETLEESLARIEAQRDVPASVAPEPLREPGSVVRETWLQVERPIAAPTPRVRSGWIEVAGLAGSRESHSYDVVIVLDVSGSTRYASGADVDGDGVVGTRRFRVEPWRVFEPSFYSSDPEDTVLDAEIEATRRLVERLDPARTRIGLVAFSDLARPRAPLGSSPELLALVLDDLSGAFGAGPTNLADATRLAVQMLEGADAASAPEGVVLILSDGYPTHPEPEDLAAAAALHAAEEAGRAGVRITTVSLGLDEPRNPDVFAEMALTTGGEHLRVRTPGDVVHALPTIDLARVAALSIENATTGEPGRATRLRPDGSFDSWVRLAPGGNRIVVTARTLEGGTARRERVVFYDAGTPDPDEIARIQKQIELRTLEIELEREVRAAKQRRVLTLDGAFEPETSADPRAAEPPGDP